MEFLNNFSQITVSDWHDLLKKSTYTSPFQTPEFYRVLKDTKCYDAEVYALSVYGELKIIMLISLMKEPGIKGFFSRRGIVFGGPVFKEVSAAECTFFFHNVKRSLKSRVIYIETRNLFDYSDYKEAFISSGFQYEPHLNFQLSLSGYTRESLLMVFDNDVRRRIKRTISKGVTYGECLSKKDLWNLYNILSDLYINRTKLPLPQYDFFVHLYNSGIIKVFIVKHGDKIIGGSFCPYNANGIYTFYYCADRNYNKHISPTHLSILAAMEFAIENGIPKFDFMGAGKPDIHYGVRDFKKQFGGKEVEQGRFIKILNPFLFKVGKISIQILMKVNK